MKKTLTFLLVVVAMAALATNASAITCTIDQHPAATLLLPYFQVQVNSDGSIPTDTTYRDTIVAIGNASAVPTLAHVAVYNHRSVLAIDFMIALTPFDIQTFRMSDILTGTLPSTPSDNNPDINPTTAADNVGDPPAWDACQRNPGADELPAVDGFLRFRPTITAGPIDNSSATTQYSTFASNGAFANSIYDILDEDANDDCGADIPDGVNTGLLTGYVVIDMANYCSLSNPSDASYWAADAAGWENNLWGDYTLRSGNAGIPTYGAPLVAIEADPASLNGFPIASLIVSRTYYGRYWEDSNVGNIGDAGGTTGNGDENCYLAGAPPCVGAYPFLVDVTYGDMREPLGVNWAARYVTGDGTSIASYFRVWRASADFLTDLTGLSCTAEEPTIAASLYDEDENTTSTGGCPSPCTLPPLNFPFETQRDAVNTLGTTPGHNGWVALDFLNLADPNTTNLDQAWVGYDFEAGGAFLDAGIDGTSLDPSTCAPAGIPIVGTGAVMSVEVPSVPAK